MDFKCKMFRLSLENASYRLKLNRELENVIENDLNKPIM